MALELQDANLYPGERKIPTRPDWYYPDQHKKGRPAQWDWQAEKMGWVDLWRKWTHLEVAATSPELKAQILCHWLPLLGMSDNCQHELNCTAWMTSPAPQWCLRAHSQPGQIRPTHIFKTSICRCELAHRWKLHSFTFANPLAMRMYYCKHEPSMCGHHNLQS